MPRFRGFRRSALNEYSDEFLDHYRRPRLVGDLEDPDAVAIVHNDARGDLVRIALRLSADGTVVEAVRVKAFGCAAVIATASVVAERVEGGSVSAARELDEASVDAALGGLPPSRVHALGVVCEALRRALDGLEAGLDGGRDTREAK